MRVFITWSGNTSKAIGTALRDFIPTVVQSVQPFMSEADITKGAKWEAAISSELESADVGIICLTPTNLTAPWILFEAGALSKKMGKSAAYVCTYLHRVQYSDVEPPLSLFQHTRADKDDTLRLLQDIRKLSPNSGLSEDGLNRLFERMWPDLERTFSQIPETASTPHRTTADKLDELLGLTREIVRTLPMVEWSVAQQHFLRDALPKIISVQNLFKDNLSNPYLRESAAVFADKLKAAYEDITSQDSSAPPPLDMPRPKGIKSREEIPQKISRTAKARPS